MSSKPPRGVLCGADTTKHWEGMRYVWAHTTCRRRTTDPSGRCWQHRSKTPNPDYWLYQRPER